MEAAKTLFTQRLGFFFEGLNEAFDLGDEAFVFFGCP